jgi:hypothetical protein
MLMEQAIQRNRRLSMESLGILVEKEARLGSDPRWRLVEQIIASQTFSKAVRLSQFLAYVSEYALTGRADEINEQNIGEQVFERSSGYDPGQDNIVRVQASRLRQRLEEFFSKEGAREELCLIIPKGGYVPQFISRSLQQLAVRENESLANNQATQEVLPKPSLIPGLAAASSVPIAPRRRFAYAMILSFFFLSLLGIVYVREHDSGASFSLFGLRFFILQRDSANPLWAQVFEKSLPTVIVPADSGLVLYESQANKTISLAEYLSGNVQTVPEINPSATFDMPTSKTTYRYTSIVDLQVATRLSQLPDAVLQGHSKVRYARDLKLEDLKGENVVLMGDKGANPWVELFEPQMNFSFGVDRTTHNSVITNKNPQSGEPPVYYRDPKDPTHPAYGLVALVSNLDRTGSVLILEGATLPGTEAASDFAFDGKRLMTLLHPYINNKGSLPHFEILLQTTVVGGGAPESKVLAYRIHPG